jgi:hypothetical protein
MELFREIFRFYFKHHYFWGGGGCGKLVNSVHPKLQCTDLLFLI